jgi:DNA-binding NtrC family response regulator
MNILVVEDNEDVRAGIVEFLSRAGHAVVECGNGRRALECLSERRTHLVFSDIQMPGMDGHTLLRKVKSNPALKDAEVILFTGFGSVRDAVEAMRDGAFDYLLKPVNVREIDVLVHKVQELISLREENRRLTEAFDTEVHRAAKSIEDELIAVRRAYAREMGALEIGIFSESMRALIQSAETLHRNPEIPVLIEGETGTGKELIAHFIHFGRGEVLTPFVGLNCAAIPSALFESELFGYEAGAFTGGNPKGQTGKLELAKDGTLFLDEISEMPVEHQAKLLRVIQEREFFRVGGLKRMQVRARIICTTNRNVHRMAEEGQFRSDLYYRLHVGYIRVPPLRERKEEILPLTQLFLDQLRQKKNTRFERIEPDAVPLLAAHSWPGNVRELKNAVERIVLYMNEESVGPRHVEWCLAHVAARPQAGEPGLSAAASPTLPMEGFELPEAEFNLDRHTLAVVARALDKHRGNKTQTAHYLGVSVRTLYTYLKHLGRE